MAETSNIIDYTNRDYESLLMSMLDLAAQKLPEWTDRSENDIARMLLEMFAYTGDVLLYYQDRIANEAFLSTAVERRSVIDLLALIGYTLATPSPASAELTVTYNNDKTSSIIIKPGARFSTLAKDGKPAAEFIYFPQNGLPLEIIRDGTGGKKKFPGTAEKSLTVINASLFENIEVGVSNGEPNQSFTLKQAPVILPRNIKYNHYFKVVVSDTETSTGKQWTRKETLLYSLSKDEDYIVKINENDEAEIIFGDGQYGKIPLKNQKIFVSYLIGGGKAGNIPADSITKCMEGVSESIEVTNQKAASGGADRETIERARFHAPGVFRSLKRAVTEDDYVALAKNFPGVAHAKAIAPSWNYVDIYIVSEGNFLLTEEIRAGLMRYFEDLRMVTTQVNIRSPNFVTIDITIAEIGVEATFYRQEVEQRVKNALSDLFILDNLSFGQNFYLSKIYEAVENVAGVDFAIGAVIQGTRSNGTGMDQTDSIKLAACEFPHPGELNLNFTGGLDAHW